MIENYKGLVEKAWNDNSLLKNSDTQDAIRQVIEL
ncbi:MAG: 2,3,4,5-tetrahydropyridine-2,6-dicarboxylate N-succinyltransferase, partial [Bacteroidetes bacterium]